MSNSSSNKSPNGVNKLLLTLLILALLGCAALAYLWHNDLYKNGVSIKKHNIELTDLLAKANISMDSLDSELNTTLSQYQKVLEELSLIKEENSNLITNLENKKIYIRRLLNRPADPRALLEAKAEIERLKKELVYYRVQVDTLSKSKELIENKYNTTKTQFAETKEEVERVKNEKDELTDKLKEVNLSISNLSVSPTRLKRGKYVPTTKASRVDLITISLTIMGGKLIEPGEKELVLRLLGTNGEVLGANNKKALIDSDKLVSMKEKIDYDGTTTDVKFKFKQRAAYKKGTYIAEIHSDGKLVTRTMFNLR